MSLENLAMIFPGQGSQKIGMLAELHERYSCVADLFNSASDVLGFDLWDLIQNGSDESLSSTENTQPALLASSVAIWRVWNELGGPRPSYMAGHSLGEWSALVCAGVIDFEVAVKLVQLRGQYMQEAVPVGEGSMAAIIGLDAAVIKDLCENVKTLGVVSAVNFNAPGQVVIAGSTKAVEAAGAECKKQGAKRVLPLPVSGPFHTSLMEPAASRLAEDIASVQFNNPETPIVHNVTAKTESEGAKIKGLMIEQISAPVRWVECSQALVSFGVNQVIECGPGKALAGMFKRIDKTVVVQASDSPQSLVAALESLK